jgi:hypothetical protein
VSEPLDFLYLDFQRLASLASQLFEGLPTTRTADSGHQAEFSGGIEGAIPLLLKGSADTKAVLSASSSITSTIHHELVGRVIEALRKKSLLLDGPKTLASLVALPDGAFVLLSGQLQIVDPTGMARTLRMLGPTQQSLAELKSDEADRVPPGLTPTQERLLQREAQEARKRERQQFASMSKKMETFAQVTETFGGETVRVRFLKNMASIAVAVVERDKFVEALDRLVLRHGYLTGGTWTCLGQWNLAPSSSPRAQACSTRSRQAGWLYYSSLHPFPPRQTVRAH